MKQPELKIVYLPIEKIKPYKDNPRDNSKAIKKVAKSINDNGFRQPLVLDKNNVIITGHTRFEAAKTLGLEKLPCIIAADMSKEKVKAYRIADNKVAEYSTWNDSLLASEMEALKELGFDLDETGFSEVEIMELTEDIIPEKYDSSEFKEYENKAAEDILKAHNVIISCMTEKDKKWLMKLIHEDKHLKRRYTVKELKKLRKEAKKEEE